MANRDSKNSVAAHFQGKQEWEGREGVMVETEKQGNLPSEGEDKVKGDLKSGQTNRLFKVK